MRGTSRGSTRPAGEVSPLLPRPHFPHITSQDRPWGSRTHLRGCQQNPGGHTTSGTSFPDPHSTSRPRRATAERTSVPAPPPLVPTNEEELLTRWPIRSHTTNRSSARATPTPSRTSRTPRRHLPPTFTKSWTPLRVPPPHNSNASPVYSATTPTAAAHTEPVNRPSAPPTRAMRTSN